MLIGQRIRERRLQLDLTLESVAKIAEVTRATVLKYENGTIPRIPSDKVELLAKALKCSPNYIMGWDKEAPPEPKSEGSEEDVKLFNAIRALPVERKKALLQLLGIE